MTVTAVTPPTDLGHREPRTDRATPRALAHAPVGDHGLAEAALAWQHLRPRGDAAAQLMDSLGRGAAAAAHLPIAYTDDDLVATRLVRVLTGLTWAVVAGGPYRSWVGVPRHDYHRVGRALTGTWRRYRRDFTGDPADPVDTAAATALWRMALLLRGDAATGQAFSLRIAVPFAAAMLCRAAHDLGVTAVTEQGLRGRRTVMICSSADLRRLLAVTTS